MTAPMATPLDIVELPLGPLHLAIANLRATANQAGCVNCAAANLADCRAGEQPCCPECQHTLAAAEVRHATDEITQALNAASERGAI